jgi:hypothetical protein
MKRSFLMFVLSLIFHFVHRPWFIGGMVALAVFLAFLVACMRSTKSPTESEHSLLLPSVNADQMS